MAVKCDISKKPNVRRYNTAEFDQMGNPPLVIHRVLAGVAILLDKSVDWYVIIIYCIPVCYNKMSKSVTVRGNSGFSSVFSRIFSKIWQKFVNCNNPGRNSPGVTTIPYLKEILRMLGFSRCPLIVTFCDFLSNFRKITINNNTKAGNGP